MSQWSSNNLVFFNLTKMKIKKDFFLSLFSLISKIFPKNNLKFGLILVEEEKIKTWNKRYRKKNRITSSLTFKMGEDKNFIREEGNQYLGEIVICPGVAKKEALRFKRTLEKQLILLAIHGFLHLLGFDHKNLSSAQKMEELEEKIIGYLRKNLSCQKE